MAHWEPTGMGGSLCRQDPRKKMQDFYTRLVSDQPCILDDMDDILRLGGNFLAIEAEFGSDVTSRLKKSYEEASALFAAVRSMFEARKLLRQPAESVQKSQVPLQVGLGESFGHKVTPGSIRSRHYGQLITVRGLVSSCSSITPRLARCIQYCRATRRFHECDVTPPADTLSTGSVSEIPICDSYGNSLEVQHGLCQYVDIQTVYMVDPPESLVPGLRPRIIEVAVEGDLVGRYKVGERIRVVGFCMPRATRKQVARSAAYQVPMEAVVLANNIVTTPVFSTFVYETDLRNFKALSRAKDCLDILARSIAPSVFGNLDVKKALLCALVGGRDFTSAGGIRRRSELHVLLIGDTATGKSQLLRAAANTASVGMIAAGKKATPEGLTAWVTRNAHDLPVLNAGLMVQADKGLVCIDEFDKLTSLTLKSISEVMERGTVTISVPGVQSSLNARCSVVAASNTVYGYYDITKSPADNIGLDEAALSRFDFMFLLLDRRNEDDAPDSDDMLAKFVLDMHLYREPGKDCSEESTEIHSLPVWECLNPWGTAERVLSIQFLRQYINHAKQFSPVLGKPAADYLAQRYTYLRQLDAEKKTDEKIFPVTPKSLESLIRLATAMAKCRLARKVDIRDAEQAFQLMYYACFHKAPKRMSPAELKESAKKYVEAANATEKLDDPTVLRSKSLERGKRTGKREKSSPIAAESHPRPSKAVKVLSKSRFTEALGAVRALFDRAYTNDMELQELTAHLIAQSFTSDEVEHVLKQMSDENMVMVVENLVVLI